MTCEAAQALIYMSAMTKDETWAAVELMTDMSYEEFEEIWSKRPEMVTVH